MKALPLFYLTALLFSFSINTFADDDDDLDDKPAVQMLNGESIVFMDEDAQEITGLETLTLKSIKYAPELLVQGKALNIEPLLNLRYQYLTTLAQTGGLKAQAKNTQKNFARMQKLRKEVGIATRNLQAEQAKWASDKASLSSSHYQLSYLKNSAINQWGDKITAQTLNNSSSTFNKLLNGQGALLKISLPPDNRFDESIKTIFISPSANRQQAVKAVFIAPSPQVDNFTQKRQYFFKTDAATIKAGMLLSAWIPLQQQAQTGVMIPASALIWHLGEALVFVKVDEEHFSHRPLSVYQKTAEGYFVTDKLKADDEVVIVGAQMLLSQEFRGQIPDEDDDD
ncbi:MAG: hypothetical protein GQ569_04125 [Methylococcaceae bacterium]|nr:hypothetical protein [Methylococcaceae bacterium]